ncbi:MAG: hypothetical protein AAFN09_09225 [Pseudomonadota bacterium]
MLDFTQSAALKLDFELDAPAFEASPEFRDLQCSYRSHRCARQVSIAPSTATENLFARSGSRMATEVLDLTSENIFA